MNHKYPLPCCDGKKGCGCCIYLGHTLECFPPRKEFLRTWQGESRMNRLLERLGVETVYPSARYL